MAAFGDEYALDPISAFENFPPTNNPSVSGVTLVSGIVYPANAVTGPSTPPLTASYLPNPSSDGTIFITFRLLIILSLVPENTPPTYITSLTFVNAYTSPAGPPFGPGENVPDRYIAKLLYVPGISPPKNVSLPRFTIADTVVPLGSADDNRPNNGLLK
ncbi:hypothetical protein AX774_g1647 [Zancudomyces culisetae]|uniref:Uncharacterized protein n=1 Tax=Zancudomyces culisetae TaxID=1213189 RepID=A0A1R1PV44_ZANCU|nr:hypothetical protein AX774_g1647 [Zancudomyces culisetae]|eukprot:OMH84814.1 hypothetical protein AX774_g1647 [Zancudomyces culisetae]